MNPSSTLALMSRSLEPNVVGARGRISVLYAPYLRILRGWVFVCFSCPLGNLQRQLISECRLNEVLNGGKGSEVKTAEVQSTLVEVSMSAIRCKSVVG